MNALTLVFMALCVFALAYRYYGLFIANMVLNLHPGRPTPAVTMADGHDYVETNRYVLLGHHFAATAAAGALLVRPLHRLLGDARRLFVAIIGLIAACVLMPVPRPDRPKGLSSFVRQDSGGMGMTGSAHILFHKHE
jgi:carbon starvation protein